VSESATAAKGAGATTSDVAGRAGRGGVAVLGAKSFFILSGLLQQAGLSAALGQRGYGELAPVLAFANIVNNVVVASSTQGVSRAVAQSSRDEAGAIRATLRIHVVVAVLVAIGFALAAPLVAYVERGPEMTAPLLVMAVVVLAYGLYAPLVGSLNGRGLFARQAGLDVLFAAMRTVLMIGVAFALKGMGRGVLGATTGFAIAAATIFVVATRVAGTGRASLQTTVERRSYLTTLAPLALAQLFVNLVMQADILLLRPFLVVAAEHTGLQGPAASDAASAWVAVYRACQLFAFLPYQLLVSLTQVLFPMLAHARADNDSAKVKEYVARGARLGAIATGVFVAVVAATPQSLLGFLYSPAIAAQGASTLRVLALAQGAFAMFAIGSTILASVSRERTAARLTLLALTLSATACAVLVPRATFGEAQLVTSARAVGSALFLSLGVAAWLVKRETGAFVALRTAARVALAIAVTVAVGSQLPVTGRLVTPVVCALSAAVYMLMLVVTREVRAADVRDLTAILRRRRAAS